MYRTHRTRQLMGTPGRWTTPSPPFTHTGINVAGPLIDSSKRRESKPYKCWICSCGCDGFIAACRQFNSFLHTLEQFYRSRQGVEDILQTSSIWKLNLVQLLSMMVFKGKLDPSTTPHMRSKWWWTSDEINNISSLIDLLGDLLKVKASLTCWFNWRFAQLKVVTTT